MARKPLYKDLRYLPTTKLLSLVLQYRLEHAESRPSDSDVALHLNALLFGKGYRPLNLNDARVATRTLVEKGKLIVIEPEDRWRENHGWVVIPPLYGQPDGK